MYKADLNRVMKRSAHPGILERRYIINSTMDVPFTLEEMKRAIVGSGLTSPGRMKSAM